MNFKHGWYVIYTKPRHEKKVSTRLTEMSIDTFLPTKKTVRTWHDRKKVIDEPLFPSYVFIYLKDMESYFASMDAEGSLYFVKTGKDIARVSDVVVNNIRLVIEGEKDVEVSGNHFLPGRKLIINKGPLTGVCCELVEVANKQKLLVRVDLLQRNILLTMSRDYLTSL